MAFSDPRSKSLWRLGMSHKTNEFRLTPPILHRRVVINPVKMTPVPSICEPTLLGSKVFELTLGLFNCLAETRNKQCVRNSVHFWRSLETLELKYSPEICQERVIRLQLDVIFQMNTF
ncbi:hypothetical protein ILYODFUR_028123 [Ilyodon furcidens]|uniref:Uncharacterized protein n=1 Tax=Ilyodon furcidens TaxID=33524 RepID=A0ABV0UK50_9TELE